MADESAWIEVVEGTDGLDNVVRIVGHSVQDYSGQKRLWFIYFAVGDFGHGGFDSVHDGLEGLGLVGGHHEGDALARFVGVVDFDLVLGIVEFVLHCRLDGIGAECSRVAGGDHECLCCGAVWGLVGAAGRAGQ